VTDLVKTLAQPAVFPWVCLALGLVAGSFLNVVIHRLPKMMEREWREQCAELAQTGEPYGSPVPPPQPKPEVYNLFVPRSRCPSCGHSIPGLENIPLVSWAVLRGRCSACGTRISLRYPLVELIAGGAAYWCATRYGASLAAFGAMVFVWSVLAASVIDLDTQLLPDGITLPLLWLGLILNLGATFIDLRSAVIGAVAGYLSLWSVYWIFRLATGKEGMGYGDFKLLAAIGAWTGWQVLPFVIVASAGVGAIVGGAVLVVSKKGADTRIPFGPYLALGGILGLLWGREAITAWLGRFPG